MSDKIKLYMSQGCQPCEELKAKMGKTPPENVEIIDILSDQGFADFSKEVLSKRDGGVPSAYKNGRECQILVEEDGISFQCPTETTLEGASTLDGSAPPASIAP